MVEGARLESVYTATYRGFESLLLRHLLKTVLHVLLLDTLSRRTLPTPRAIYHFFLTCHAPDSVAPSTLNFYVFLGVIKPKWPPGFRAEKITRCA